MAPRKTRTNAEETSAPPSRVRCKLNTIDDIKAEMARIYREAKAGTRSVGDASRLVNMLSLHARLIEGADFERRMAIAETLKLEKGEHPWSQNH